MSQYYLGFDAGTQSVKVAVYDENMNCIVSSSAPTTLTYPEPGWVSMDVDEYLALTIKGMKECASLMKEKGLDVDVNAITVEEAKDSILKALKKGGKADD